MKIHMNRFVLLLLGSMLLVSTGCSAADHDFNSVVSAVEQKYSVHAQRIPMILKTAVKSVGERQRVVSVALCTAPHLTKMVKSSMFATVFTLNQLAILTHFDCRF